MQFTFILVLAALTRAIGDFRDPIYALVTAVFVGFLWRGFPVVPPWNRAVNRLFKWSAWVLAVGLLRWLPPPASLALATGLVWTFGRYGDQAARLAARPLVLTGTLYTLWWTVCFQLPPVYRWLTEWSYAYTHLITGAMSRRLILGPSASAVDLLLLGLCGVAGYLLSARPRRWQPAIMVAVALEAGRIIYIWFAPLLYGVISNAMPVSTTPHLDLPAVYLVFVAGVLALCPRIGLLGEDSGFFLAAFSRPRLWVPAALLAVTFAIAGVASYNYGPVRVLFLDKSTLDQSVPNFQRFGDRSGGMFGFLPLYLADAGYTVYRQDLTPGILDSVDVIIIANLLKTLPAGEKYRIQEFVKNGGGLLVLGDHTGTDAIRDPTNDLLAPVGLELDFDTAVPLRRSWVNAKNYLFHPLGRSGGVMDGELWLGASVTPGPSGEAFLVGRGAFSDPGDRNNKKRAYLGDLEYRAGEPLGDVVLAAAAHWGKGRVILHGDTSPYQNGTIVRSHSLINRSLRWITNTGWTRFLDRWRTWLLALVFAGVGTWLVTLALQSPVWLLTALLLPVVSVSFWSAVPGPQGRTWLGRNYRIALVDLAHKPMFDGMSWENRSIGGLEFNLMRNGYSMQFADATSDVDRYDASLYVIFAPTRPISSSEADRLERYIDRGGWVLVSAGWNLHRNVAELLKRFDLSVENIPLGALNGEAFADTVRMADAYPIGNPGGGAESLIDCYGYPVARIARRGDGGLIAVGDSQFFYNRNLESQENFVVIENVNFIRRLLQSTSGSDPK